MGYFEDEKNNNTAGRLTPSVNVTHEGFIVTFFLEEMGAMNILGFG